MTHPNLDENNVWRMSEPLKIYVFKDEGMVKISFRLTDYANFGRQMSIEKFQYIVDNWEHGHDGEGVQGLQTKDGKYWIYRSRSGPRPERVSADFVVVNTGGWSLRYPTDYWRGIMSEFQRQIIEKNHWD